MNFSKQNILIIEDNIDTLDIMTEIFESVFFVVYRATDGYEALKIFKKNEIDVVLCDINIPNLTGLEIIDNIRKDNYSIPIIIISAYTDSETLLKASNSSIQGYINKPLTSDKVQSILEKIHYHQNHGLINKIAKINNSIIMELQNYQIVIDNKTIRFTQKEIKFIKLLLQKKGEIVSYKIIEQLIWYDEDKVMTSTSLRTLVKNIRKKISIDIIENIPRIGYRLMYEDIIIKNKDD